MLQELTERETEIAAFSDSHGMKATAEAYGLTINQVDRVRRKRRKRMKALELGAAGKAGLVEIKGGRKGEIRLTVGRLAFSMSVDDFRRAFLGD